MVVCLSYFKSSLAEILWNSETFFLLLDSFMYVTFLILIPWSMAVVILQYHFPVHWKSCPLTDCRKVPILKSWNFSKKKPCLGNKSTVERGLNIKKYMVHGKRFIVDQVFIKWNICWIVNNSVGKNSQEWNIFSIGSFSTS